MLIRFQTRHDSLIFKKYSINQNHSIRVARIFDSKYFDSVFSSSVEADALWTTCSNTLILVKTGDCCAIVILNTNLCAGVIHAGWRGACMGIVLNMFDDIRKTTNLNSYQFVAFMGPCIKVNAYNIKYKTTLEIPEQFLRLRKDQRIVLNLSTLIRYQLDKLKICKINILNHCTFSKMNSYYSARRGDKQRQFSVVLL